MGAAALVSFCPACAAMGDEHPGSISVFSPFGAPGHSYDKIRLSGIRGGTAGWTIDVELPGGIGASITVATVTSIGPAFCDGCGSRARHPSAK